MDEPESFKQLLTEAIYRIKSLEQKSISIIHDELGYQLGKTGSLIEHWRKGNIPHLFTDLEIIAESLEKRAQMGRKWLSKFLIAGQHPAPHTFLEKLFPTQFVYKLTLPTQSLPEPAPLPFGSVMTLVKNPLFVGRKQNLLKIAILFTDQPSSSQPQSNIIAACGLGGVGKTQLASEFVHRFGPFFPGGVFWLNFEESENIPSQVAKCGGPGVLNLVPNYQELPLEDQLQLVRAAWQKSPPRLIIFDNCEDPALLETWRPTSGGCRILITSRRSEWDPALGVHTIPLGVLYRHESVSLLKQLINIESQNQNPLLEEIADEVGDLPLALHMAGRYLLRYRRIIRPEAYLARLKNPQLLQHPSFTTGGISPTRHVQNIWRTFALSYDQLDQTDDIDQYAHANLVRAAHFAPGEPIWVALLSKTISSDESEEVVMLRVDQGFSRLLELGLIEVDNQDFMRMHRLVAAFVREIAAEEVQQTKHIIQTTVLKEASRINKEGLPLPLLDWQIHLRSIIDLEDAPDDLHHARLCSEIGEHFKQMGDLKSAFPYFKKSVTILDAIHGTHHPETAKGYHNLGWLLRELTHFERAFDYLSKALAIRLESYGKTYPATAESFNELGRWYLSQGNLEKAEEYFSQAREISLAVLEYYHPLTADFCNNLGMCLSFQKKFEQGLELVLEALKIRTQIFGEFHPRTALSMNNVGYILRDLHQYDEAETYYEQALKVRRHIFGEVNPATAESLINLGDLKMQRKDYEGAKINLLKALDIYIKMENEEHLFVASCYFNLGIISEAENDLDEAMTKLGKSLDIRRSRLGEKHQSTVNTREKLKEILQKRGLPNKANPEK